MAKGIKTGGGSRKGIPNKRTLLFADVANKVGDVATQFTELSKFTCEKDPVGAANVRFRALELYCRHAFPLPKQQVEHSGVEFGIGNLIPHERDSATVN